MLRRVEAWLNTLDAEVVAERLKAAGGFQGSTNKEFSQSGWRLEVTAVPLRQVGQHVAAGTARSACAGWRRGWARRRTPVDAHSSGRGLATAGSIAGL
jgi:hypothetical protein